MILLIDNYDSFSYNLFQLLGSRNPDIKVIRNDALTIAQIESLHPQAILLSPGPGKPQEAGICMDVVSAFYHKIPILGICLGHQAIYSAFGGQVSYAKQLLHGKQTPILLDTSCPIHFCWDAAGNSSRPLSFFGSAGKHFAGSIKNHKQKPGWRNYGDCP